MKRNVHSITEQLRSFFTRGLAKADSMLGDTVSHHTSRMLTGLSVLNNADWHNKISLMDFLNHAGSVKISAMLSRERSVLASTRRCA